LKTEAMIKRFKPDLDRLLLFFIMLFTFTNWLILTLAEQLGPPDVYKLYNVAEKLFSGNFKIGIVPPLFPLIQYPISKILAIFMAPMDAFVLAGRLLSLGAGLGVIGFTYAFLKRFTERYALLGVAFLVVSPWYLKLLSFPITDMLYLFFVSAAFYWFLPQKKRGWGLSALAIVGGVLTRFEGVLLILSGLLNYFKFKKKYFLILMGAVPLVAALLIFFFTFADRFFAHLKDIILAQKSYLFMFQHPMDFLNVIYGNILFFIPFSYPYLIKLLLLIIVLALFGYGIFQLFMRQRNLTIALLVYEFFFLAAKGYVDTTRPEIEFRRIFSGLWVFYILCFIGGYFFLKKINTLPKIKRTVYAVGVILLAAVSISLPMPQPLTTIVVVLVVFPVLYFLKDIKVSSFLKYPMLFVLLIFTGIVYHFSFVKSRDYVVSMAPKAPYAAAQWLNMARIKSNATVLSYTDNVMMGYYLDKKFLANKNIKWETFTIPLRISEETKARYIRAFFREIKKRHVDYIIFDNYVVPMPEFTDVNQAKRMLFEERENKTYFRVKKYLFYKGENVGYVLKPIDAETNY
jgi:hypothetical protein